MYLKHILNVAGSLIFQSDLLKIYYSYVVSHFVHIINRLHSMTINGKSLYKMLHDLSLTYLNL